MTNRQIIHETIQTEGLDYNYNGENLKTFNEWKKAGYSVNKGQKAFITCQLWKRVEKKVKDKDGNIKKESQFISKKTALFTPDQVKPLSTNKQSKTA